MKTKNHSYEPKFPLKSAVKDGPKIKTVGLWVGVTDGNLEAKIKRAFDLAKSGGRELDLTVSSSGPSQSALTQFPLQ